MEGNGIARDGAPSGAPPDFTFVMPTGEIVRGRVWMITDSQVVENGHTFGTKWNMVTANRGHSMRWVLIEDV